ncbi:unnamed protein product (macronuclear) [Paramecium tetraurelia]|uniref:HECT-type E3 ubiquitin transferase n=1 Tax=Paramecium tetraurelia TaxID=5888 RepID=A0D438_PARTE|nr:uncharacterized protein GSPATT00013270001 [Paramecium tetraurelia]CAK77805.1 unnamed protein product [Paramecium tetraurelia]|eukprot:XP_001445202.1 hypothetical protein (macronuclear) [Paramecium tetraurelia strain d4-2]
MGCCCSIKSPSQTTLGREVECPKCQQLFPSYTTNHAVKIQNFNLKFNDHLDNCLMSSQQNINKTEDYRGIKYWEKVQNEQGFQWVLKEYNPSLQINEQNISSEPFGQKQVWFRAKLEKLRIPWQNGCTILSVSQNHLLETSIESIMKLKSRLLHGELKIKFQEDQKVQDAGGLLREWSTSILQQLVEMEYLQKTETKELTYKFNPNIQSNTIDKRQLFSFLGIIVGKCLFERIPLSSFLDRTIIKHILRQKVTLEDIKYFDEDLFYSWQYLLNNNIDQLDLYFQLEYIGKTINLKENGCEIKVTNSNVQEYVNLNIFFYTQQFLEPYLSDFLTGFYQVIPKTLLRIFNPQELEMILFGLPFIDLQDWSKYTIYKECSAEDYFIQWFWQILSAWNQAELSQFLRFCTGSTRVPVEGFSKLESNRGEISYFCIQASEFDKDNPYPKAHTCFNRLELPKYQELETMEVFLKATIHEALEGQFGLE